MAETPEVAFVVNPIAGMGGRVGLKGTDGVVEEAIRRGAEPVAPGRARAFLEALECEVRLLTAGGPMGEDVLRDLRIPYEVIYRPGTPTTAEDTREFCRRALRRGAGIVVFVGGDGTARDVLSVVDGRIPILGVPSGVKMYSSVFGAKPEDSARILCSFLEGRAPLEEGEVLDIDEEAFRSDELRLRHFGLALVPRVPELVQGSKEVSGGEEQAKWDIAEFIVDNYGDGLLIVGPGTTASTVARVLGQPYTLLGVDAYYRRRLVGRDLDERGILRVLEAHEDPHLVVGVIGGQGFVFGRGNQQISPRVLRRLPRENIHIVATPSKLSKIRYLRMDLGDPELEERLRGYWRVLVGYGRFRLMKMV